MRVINFKGKELFVFLNKGRLEATDTDGFPYMSISLFHESLKDDEIAIKNYSENQGILEVLLKNNIVTEPHRFIKQGFVEVPVCRFLIS